MRVVILNGPNLNLLGVRSPEVYGSESFDSFIKELRRDHPQQEILYFQTNHEGQLIDWLHQHGFSNTRGIILNAGGYAHTSVAIRDAIEAIEVPVIDVHISNIYEREEFRRVNLLSEVCAASFVGHGLKSYTLALESLL